MKIKQTILWRLFLLRLFWLTRGSGKFPLDLPKAVCWFECSLDLVVVVDPPEVFFLPRSVCPSQFFLLSSLWSSRSNLAFALVLPQVVCRFGCSLPTGLVSPWASSALALVWLLECPTVVDRHLENPVLFSAFLSRAVPYYIQVK